MITSQKIAQVNKFNNREPTVEAYLSKQKTINDYLVVHIYLVNTITATGAHIRVEAKVVEGKGSAFWNSGIPINGGTEGKGIHWRRICKE